MVLFSDCLIDFDNWFVQIVVYMKNLVSLIPCLSLCSFCNLCIADPSLLFCGTISLHSCGVIKGISWPVFFWKLVMILRTYSDWHFLIIIGSDYCSAGVQAQGLTHSYKCCTAEVYVTGPHFIHFVIFETKACYVVQIGLKFILYSPGWFQTLNPPASVF